MQLLPLVVILPVALILSACGGGSKPPATPAPAAAAKATTTVAAVPKAPAKPLPAASAKAIAPLLGTWAADLGSCGGGGTISITAKQFASAENKCVIAFGDNKDGTFIATLNCDNGGQKTTERVAMNPVFAPTGEGITMTYLDRGNQEVTVLRCVAKTAAQ